MKQHSKLKNSDKIGYLNGVDRYGWELGIKGTELRDRDEEFENESSLRVKTVFT